MIASQLPLCGANGVTPSQKALGVGKGVFATVRRSANDAHATAADALCDDGSTAQLGKCTGLLERNTFTVSDTRRCSAAKWEIEQAMAALPTDGLHCDPFQLEMVRQERLLENDLFVKRIEQEAYMNESGRRHAVKQLMRLAAKRDVELAARSFAATSEHAASLPAHSTLNAEVLQRNKEILQLMSRTWRTLLHMLDQFFIDADAEEAARQAEKVMQDGGASPQAAPRDMPPYSTIALENLSSLGVWFNGPDISLPLRRFIVQLPTSQPPAPSPEAAHPEEAGQILPFGCGGDDEAAAHAPTGVTEVVVIGLAVFAYSTYVMEVRQQAQYQRLQDLQLWSAQLGHPVRFIPQVVLQVPYIPFSGPS